MMDELDGKALLGNPYHGLIKGGLVYLPNADTVAHPQPAGSANTSFPYAASAMLLAPPDAPGLARDAAEAAADALKGWRWDSTAVLSGCRYLYGKDIGLGNWIFSAPSGRKWLIDPGMQGQYVSRFATQNLINADWTATAFGELGVAAEVQNGPMSLADAGQATPILWYTYPTDEQAGGRLFIMDISPDGSAAIFGLYGNPVNNPNSHRYPIGIYQVGVTETAGAISIGITMLKDREQCLGSRAWFDNVVQTTASIWSHTTTTTCDPPLGGSCNETTVSDWAAYPAGFDPGADPDYTLENVASVTTGDRGYTVTGKIVGMYFDAAGLVREVTCDKSRSEVYSYPDPTASSGGSRVVKKTRPADGSPITYELVSETRTASCSRSGSTTTTTSFTINGPGINKTITDISISSVTDDWPVTYAASGGHDGAGTITRVTTTNGAPGTPIVYPVPGALYTSIDDLFTVGASTSPMTDPFDPLFNGPHGEYLRPGNVRGYAVMFTNKLAGIYEDDAPNSQVSYGPMGGSEAASAAVDTISGTPYFITYNPATFEIVRGESEAVNFV